ncbi:MULTISPECIES: iron-hydroxamate ABC transporter substrate-binding protein [Bacillaceae]|uniref:iron-hydroxamate ABC transporter substrate-binding protein n=1 Tax=Bacillaceae TaxID=186817 RepID=UPI001E374212|nr:MULTISPECIES: iron-hydroxamate ABC transporter substrate-binding protein [Bacillaceae]MCE4049851.1 iron-hydroxamate ABC transporter substrate-binding protein [Bacillus sp. Au-Bac7]MCM3033192.1 iron-hydroxamate ABC transporter substrate-binding protein [Niallia sp. MER 6]MDL0435419.1 iron-hydroxamate ABC transporter substrate-binding protein [Niallia sp. SS-2023]UPO87607.1 iron-hydroxamate ABC transporter substrate-binding protein [Niallia sp. Man26]
MSNKMVKSLLFASLLLVFTILAACGNESDSDKDTGTDTAEEAKDRTLTDAMGHEVTVPAEPKAVIGSYLEDELVALGVTPAAQWSIQDGAGVQDYLQDSLKDVPTVDSELPYEAVASFNPDLLLMTSAATVEGAKYEQYTNIAPTYVVSEENNNDWRKRLETVGEVLGKEDEAKKVLADYDKKAEEAKASIQEAAKGESAAAIWLVGGQLFMVGENVSSGAVLYGDLGLAVPEVVKEISKTATGNWSSVSLEKLAELDADHLFLINSDGEAAETLKDPLWSNIPAVKNGNVYEFSPDTSWLYSGSIANTQIIDDVVESLTK